MIVMQTEDIDDIKKVLCDDSIYHLISNDKCPSSDEFEPPVNKDYTYIAGYVNGDIIALMIYHSYEDGNKCHFHVLPSYRLKYARDFAKKSLEYRGELPLYVEISDLHKSTLNFALSNGFNKIGIKEGDKMISKSIYNINVLRYKNELC